MLFPYLGYAATMNPRVQMSLLHTDFISFGYVTKDSDCVPVVILNFLRNLCTIFHNGCFNSYSHNSVQELIFLHILSNS